MNGILGPPTVDREAVRNNAAALGATALGVSTLIDLLWDAAVRNGIRPEGMVAQSFKETGGWKYEGRVKEWFHNTAGIKVRHVDEVKAVLGTSDDDHPLVHQQFPNWEVGCEAHAQRLLDYCLQPIDGLIVDPRHGFGNRGITTWEELGGRWAPSPTYGAEVWALAQRLAGGSPL